MQRSSRKTVTGQLQNRTGLLFLVFCCRWRWTRSSAAHFGAFFLVFGARKSMDSRGDLLLSFGSVVVLFGGPRWSRKSMDHRGDLLFVLVLVSSGLGPGKSQIPGGI